jgi:hypothetical protein
MEVNPGQHRKAKRSRSCAKNALETISIIK